MIPFIKTPFAKKGALGVTNSALAQAKDRMLLITYFYFLVIAILRMRPDLLFPS